MKREFAAQSGSAKSDLFPHKVLHHRTPVARALSRDLAERIALCLDLHKAQSLEELQTLCARDRSI